MNTWSQLEELHEISANHLYECKPVKNEAVMIPLGTVAAAWECCECSLPSYLPFLYYTFFTECKLPTFCCVLKLSTPFLFAQKENPPPTHGADALSYLQSYSHFVLALVGLQVSSLPRMAKVNLKHKLFFEIWWPCLISHFEGLSKDIFFPIQYA